jgi:hypothetical protein
MSSTNETDIYSKPTSDIPVSNFPKKKLVITKDGYDFTRVLPITTYLLNNYLLKTSDFDTKKMDCSELRNDNYYLPIRRDPNSVKDNELCLYPLGRVLLNGVVSNYKEHKIENRYNNARVNNPNSGYNTNNATTNSKTTVAISFILTDSSGSIPIVKCISTGETVPQFHNGSFINVLGQIKKPNQLKSNITTNDSINFEFPINRLIGISAILIQKPRDNNISFNSFIDSKTGSILDDQIPKKYCLVPFKNETQTRIPKEYLFFINSMLENLRRRNYIIFSEACLNGKKDSEKEFYKALSQFVTIDTKFRQVQDGKEIEDIVQESYNNEARKLYYFLLEKLTLGFYESLLSLSLEIKNGKDKTDPKNKRAPIKNVPLKKININKFSSYKKTTTITTTPTEPILKSDDYESVESFDDQTKNFHFEDIQNICDTQESNKESDDNSDDYAEEEDDDEEMEKKDPENDEAMEYEETEEIEESELKDLSDDDEIKESKRKNKSKNEESKRGRDRSNDNEQDEDKDNISIKKNRKEIPQENDSLYDEED